MVDEEKMKSSYWGSRTSFDYSFKILLVGDSGVGKTSLLMSFVSDSACDLSPTVGVDFKIRLIKVGEKRLKLTIWDTAGQERFGALMGSYYRGTHGILLVYDVTKRESFTSLSDIWAKEAESYSTYDDCVRILVGNKVDMESGRVVMREEGAAFAKEHNCSFLECSATTGENVRKCFQQLVLKILEVPSLVEKGSAVVKRQLLEQKDDHRLGLCRTCCS